MIFAATAVTSHLLWLYRPVCVGPVQKLHCWFYHEAVQMLYSWKSHSLFIAIENGADQIEIFKLVFNHKPSRRLRILCFSKYRNAHAGTYTVRHKLSITRLTFFSRRFSYKTSFKTTTYLLMASVRVCL